MLRAFFLPQLLGVESWKVEIVGLLVEAGDLGAERIGEAGCVAGVALLEHVFVEVFLEWVLFQRSEWCWFRCGEAWFRPVFQQRPRFVDGVHGPWAAVIHGVHE